MLDAKGIPDIPVPLLIGFDIDWQFNGFTDLMVFCRGILIDIVLMAD